MINKSVFGYFDNISEIPSYDPGLEIECIICGKQLSQPIKTISICGENSSKSFFYRTHKNCYENALEEKIIAIESLIIDYEE